MAQRIVVLATGVQQREILQAGCCKSGSVRLAA
jgi:hypothetical protein